MIEYKGTKFENNPNAISTAVQFEGRVHLKYNCEPCISVYGFSQAQCMEVAKQFAAIEPKASLMELYGPENVWAPRNYVDTILL